MMNGRKLKAAAGLMVVVLLTMLVAACSGGTSSSGDKQPVNGDPGNEADKLLAELKNSESSPFQPALEISIASIYDPPKNDHNYVQRYLEQKFNIKIKNIRLDTIRWREQLNMLLATGEIPDIMPGVAVDSDMVEWVEQGIIASIPEEEIRRYMPRYVADFESVTDTVWNVGRFKGENWGVPRIWGNGTLGFLPAYNEDWLQTIGYLEPPKTLTELEDVLTKFAYNDPDGNNEHDTYGMTGRAKDSTNQMFNLVFSTFGINPYYYAVEEDGEIAYSGLSEETRQGLKLLNKWFEQGLIDPEFITDSNGEIRSKFVAEKIGVFDTGMWQHLYDDGYFGATVLEQGIDMVIGKPLVGSKGVAYSLSNGSVQAPLMFGAQLQNDPEKRARILQMLEFVGMEEEGFLTTVFGIEGVTYAFDGEVAVYIEENGGADARAELGVGGFYNPLSGRVVAMEKFYLSPEKLEFRAQHSEGFQFIYDALGTTVLPSKSKYYELLRTLQDQYFIKAISGEADTDRDFDDFVAQWLKSGGQVLLDEANQLYAERNAGTGS